MQPPPAPDYFAILEAKRRTVSLHLAEGETLVRRARLGLYAELVHINESDAPPEEKALVYIERATGRPIDDFDPEHLLETYARLLELNKTLGVPAMLRVQSRGRTPNAFKYEGRWLVSLVQALVGAGWSPDYVLEEMDPDEAWLYLQEIQYAEWESYQREYSLSTVGRDKHGKQSKMNAPPWSFTGYEAPRVRSGRRPKPAGVSGVVIDFTDPAVAADARKRLSS